MPINPRSSLKDGVFLSAALEAAFNVSPLEDNSLPGNTLELGTLQDEGTNACQRSPASRTNYYLSNALILKNKNRKICKRLDGQLLLLIAGQLLGHILGVTSIS